MIRDGAVSPSHIQGHCGICGEERRLVVGADVLPDGVAASHGP